MTIKYATLRLTHRSIAQVLLSPAWAEKALRVSPDFLVGVYDGTRHIASVPEHHLAIEVLPNGETRRELLDIPFAGDREALRFVVVKPVNVEHVADVELDDGSWFEARVVTIVDGPGAA